MGDVNIKIVLLGSARIGKTSMVRRFVENKFDGNENYTGPLYLNVNFDLAASTSEHTVALHALLGQNFALADFAFADFACISLQQLAPRCKFTEYNNTIGAAFIAREMMSLGRKIIIGIWDTAGEERYESVSRTFYRGAQAAIVCYDVTLFKTWDRAKRWISELRQFEEDCRIYLCGTKIDLLKDGSSHRAVNNDTLQTYVNGLNLKYYETSSKIGQGIGELFQVIVDDFAANNIPKEEPENRTYLTSPNRRRVYCCFS